MCIWNIDDFGISDGDVVSQWIYLHFQMKHIMLSCLQSLYVEVLVHNKWEDPHWTQFKRYILEWFLPSLQLDAL